MTWYFRTMVKLSDGTRKRISGTPGVPGPYQDLAPTKVGAIEAERRAVNAAMTGKPLAVAAQTATKEVPKRKTITEHAEGFVDTYKPGSKPGEKREKRRVLKSNLLPHFGRMTIEELRQVDVDAFAQAELARGMAVKTVNNRLAVLSTLIKYRTGEKSKLRFKLDGMMGELTAVSPSDIALLLGACNDERYRTVILLACEAGLRAGEIRGFQWTDIKDGQLTVRRALDKVTNDVIAPKHNKVRTVPLSPNLVACLAKLTRRGLWVIAESDGSSVSYEDLIATVHDLYNRANVARPVKALHCLRHSFGTEMAKRVPLPVLQKLMGHSDVKTTLRYIDVGEGDKRDAIALGPGMSATCQRESDPKSGVP